MAIASLFRNFKVKVQLGGGSKELKWRDYLTCVLEESVSATIEKRK